ncbi:Uncharacterised protein [Streptococcus pyogenes]|nr:Uncharacterised protein [Streptococcus pyogenes]
MVPAVLRAAPAEVIGRDRCGAALCVGLVVVAGELPRPRDAEDGGRVFLLVEDGTEVRGPVPGGQDRPDPARVDLRPVGHVGAAVRDGAKRGEEGELVDRRRHDAVGTDAAL